MQTQEALAGQTLAHSVAHFDARPFFEKALAYGVQHGIIDAAKLDAMAQDAPKGMVQIARYFGSEYLRPELELARKRLVNLVSLHLMQHSGGDLHRAAQTLQSHSLLSRSKAGSDLLKAMIALPQNSHFGMMDSGGGFKDEHIPILAKWSLCSWADYQAEWAKRSEVAQVVHAALWLADALGSDAAALEEAGRDAEAVIRTALLIQATGQSELPDWVTFQKTITALRSKKSKTRNLKLKPPQGLPSEYIAVVEQVAQSVLADLPKILDESVAIRKLFDQTPAFMGRYFWTEDPLSEVDDFDRAASAAWHKATGGHSDDSALLTMFLCIAAGNAPKTLLIGKAAASLVRKLRKSGLQTQAVVSFIAANAPVHHQSDYQKMWQDFVADASASLLSDHDYAASDALALLRRECNVRE